MMANQAITNAVHLARFAMSLKFMVPFSLTNIVAITFMAFTIPASAPEPVENVPLHSQIDQVQPMTGIVFWNDSEKVASDSISMEYRYCGYDEIVQANGDYDFAKLDKILDQIAGRKHQAVLRFYFVYPGKKTTVPDNIRLQNGYDETIGKSEEKKTHFCDWSNQKLEDFTLEFYTKFAERYDDDPRIAFLQTGFGLWSEYHIYDGPRKLGKTFPSKEYQARFIKHLDQTFKNLTWSISIDSADSEYSPLEDNQQLLAIKFGVFDDSFLCKQHAKENAWNWKALNAERWKTSPAGGEFSYYKKSDQKNALAPEGPNGVNFPTAAKQFHLSYIIGNDQPRYRTQEEIAAASKAIGYRFRVTSATRIENTLRLKITNTGIAPIYRDAFFSAGKKRSTKSLKGLLPNQTFECTIANVDEEDLKQIAIQCDAILPSQTIQFEADLK